MTRSSKSMIVLSLALGAFAVGFTLPDTAASSGKATVSLKGAKVDVAGEFPTMLCGGPYLLGKGWSYQVQAGQWRITVASETRESGKVALNKTPQKINVVATANGPGVQYVRGPRNAGSVTISSDFKRAEAQLDLRQIVGTETAKLVVTFVCD